MNIVDIKPLLDANRQRAEFTTKHQSAVLKVAETPANYGGVSALTDAKAIAVYAQLKTTGLDTPTCLQATALAAKIKALKYSELETRRIYDSALWQTLPESAITCLQTLAANDYLIPQQYTATEQSQLLVWQSGTMTMLFFNAAGLVIQRLDMGEARYRIIKIPAHIYYTLITDQCCTYLTTAPHHPAVQIADWAPAENHSQKLVYQQRLMAAKIGDHLSFS